MFDSFGEQRPQTTNHANHLNQEKDYELPEDILNKKKPFYNTVGKNFYNPSLAVST
jgi:hypothetical protein